jgi:surface carbohydrate biosynthesis protein (TIGR04326 family)
MTANLGVDGVLLVWDVEEVAPQGDWTTVLWRDYAKIFEPNVISIPMLVEKHSDELRKRYLAWVYELGETKINGKRVVDHLNLRSGFSYWWMTSIGQKYNCLNTSQINNAIKLLVLETLLTKRQIKSIKLKSCNKELAETLKIFCRKIGLTFEWEIVSKVPEPISNIRYLYNSLPHSFRGGVSIFRYLIKTLFSFNSKKISMTANAEISFIDVLVHLDRNAFIYGEFISNYWTILVHNLKQSEIKTNWFHIYFPQKKIPNLSKAQELLKRFNETSGHIQQHSLIQSQLNFTIFYRALWDYLSLSFACKKLSKIKDYFTPAGSNIDLWPLFQDEWIGSLRGAGSLFQCIEISLYELTFKNLNYQKVGVYIQENQPWEMALIHAWRAGGHGRLIGMPHTAVRYWDLRYFYDIRTYADTGENILPRPDKVAVNGNIAKEAYLAGGYPDSDLYEVEALRFIHLLNSKLTESTRSNRNNTFRVLICGDYLKSNTDKMLSLLFIAAQSLPENTLYTFKAHPAYPADVSKFSELLLEVSDAPLEVLFVNCDAVFTSNITTSSVDAYCSGIPVIQMLDGDTFNLSPLRGLSGSGRYVTNSRELVDALVEAFHRNCLPSESYFFLDKNLPRWRMLLNEDMKAIEVE